MNVGFVSPVHGQCGTTTVAMLTSICLALKYNRRACYLQAGNDQFNALKTYLNMTDAYRDPTRSTSQIHSLLKQGSLSPSELSAYSVPVVPNLDCFLLDEGAMSSDQVKFVQQAILEKVSYDYTCVDIGYPMESEKAHAAIKACEVLAIVLNQNAVSLSTYKMFRQNPLCNNKAIIVIVNNYSSLVGPSSKIIKRYGLPPQRTYIVHRSAPIIQMANDGKLVECAKGIASRHYTLAELGGDFDAIIKILKYHNVDIEGE